MADLCSPLDGVSVVDLTSYIAGSYAATMLADLGADVVKVESLEGDSFRELPGFFAWNRGKRSIALNLKAPEGRAVVERLARDGDVVMENMRPGVADRLGVGEAALRALNPRLIYCSTTAFVSRGPFAERLGCDPVLEGMAGIMALQGFGGPPQYIRVALVDYYAAALAAQAVLAALFVRERTGVGQKVETSLLHAVTALQAGNFVDYPGKQSVFRDNPTYRLYQAGDGEWLFLACGNQSFWVKLCQALGLEELAHDPRFASWMLRLDNREVLLPILEARFKSRPRDAWLEVLRTHDIPAGPVHTIDEFRRHPLTRHHGMAREYDHPEVGRLTLPGSPLLFSRTPTPVADAIATVTLNRPEVHNAMNDVMRRELTRCFDGLVADDDVKVVVVTGAGEKAFSAGADIREFVAPLVPVQFREHRRRVDFRQAMDRCPQPILAAVNGFAFGGGLELALACDIRVAAASAQMGLTEINLAIIPGGGGTQRLPRLVGRGKALEMILTGARIPADEALRISLVERVVPTGEALKAAVELARAIAAKAPVALRYAKEAVVKGLELPLADGLRLEGDLVTPLRTTEDRVEGAKAFLEKRAPRWTGK